MHSTQMYFFVTKPLVCPHLFLQHKMLKEDTTLTRFEPAPRQVNATSQTRFL